MLALLLLFVYYTHSVSNFILIVTDDVGYNDLTCYGSPTIRTPNIDFLAREGLRFTQFVTTSSLCTPSRGAMMTGRYPIKTGLYTQLQYPYDNGFRVFYPTSVGCLPKNETTIAEYLKNSYYKYATAMIGKHHLGHNQNSTCLPLYRGFDYFYGLPYSHEEGNDEYAIWPPIPLYSSNNIVQQPVNLST